MHTLKVLAVVILTLGCLAESREWEQWSSWTACSQTCGSGSRSRERACAEGDSSESSEENNCNGAAFQSEPCNTQACPVSNPGPAPAPAPNPGPAPSPGPGPVDGQWSQWQTISTCPCGGGKLIRTRQCNQPPPSNMGKPCTGPNQDTIPCNALPCKENGQWGPWSAFTVCSADCDGGEKTRERICDSPSPSHGGHDCIGESIQRMSCNEHPCQVPCAKWSRWGSWSKCQGNCKRGIRVRRRRCRGGHRCCGRSVQKRKCSLRGKCKPKKPQRHYG